MEFDFPESVQGWLTFTEGQVLHALASGRDVLEIGCWKGRSTICMAQSAAHVTCLDHFHGDTCTELMIGIENSDAVYDQFRANVRAAGVSQKITVIREDSRASRTYLPSRKFGFVFVDGAHDLDSVRHDFQLAAKCVEPGGVIAVHDWNMATVRQAAAEVFGWDGPDPAQLMIESEYGLYARKCERGPRPKVFVGVPHRNNVSSGVATGLIDALNYRAYDITTFRFHSTSLLTLCFNSLWCIALNERKRLGHTHFCMHHDDICPEDGWLNTLISEMKRTNADIISCVVPIKDSRGLVSTAVMEKDTRVMRRLTVHESLKLPRTFTADEIGFPNHHLLVNSGLWLCDFTKPWIEEVCFTVRDKIIQRQKEDGSSEFAAMCFSEDWVFSKWASERGLKVVATTAVKLKHQGMVEFPNDSDWGEWKSDQGKDELFDPPAQEDNFPQPHVEPRWENRIRYLAESQKKTRSPNLIAAAL